MKSSSKNKIDYFGIIMNWLEGNQKDIILVVGIILIALIGFGLGRLTAPETDKSEPVIIEIAESGTAAALNNLVQKSENYNLESTEKVEENKKQGEEQGIIVASRFGKKYHWPWCSYAKNIKPENQIWFSSEAEAQAAGYEPCGAFDKNAPAGY